MLSIPLSTLGWIIVKAREFDVKDVDTDDPGDDSDNPMGVLEDRADDPTFNELTNWINDLTDSQKAELVALYWLGRDDNNTSDFAELLEEAQGQRDRRTASYLLGSPMLGDHLEEGLERLGIDTSEVESALG